jgi:hypothetical protein
MIIKIDEASAMVGGRAVLLCDDDGVPLPMQYRVVLDQAVGEASSITVSFHIDGDKVRVAD